MSGSGLEGSDGSGQPSFPPHGFTPDQSAASVLDAPRQPLTQLEAGLFGTLFDLSLDNIAPVKLARLLYIYTVVCISAASLVSFLYGWSLTVSTSSTLLGWCLVGGVPVLWLGAMALARLVAEYVILQTGAFQSVAEVRDAVHEMRDHARSS
jgi:hypothetical protein